MSDYLSRLAGRSLGQETVLQPRLASRYEPVHNQLYQPFLLHFEWASSDVRVGDMESRTEMTESGSTLTPFEHLSSKDNQSGADDRSDGSTREDSSALRKLRSNRPSPKHSRALFNQRSPLRLKERSNSNKAIDEGIRRQQPRQLQQMHKHKLESNGHDRSATEKSSPEVVRTGDKENLSQAVVDGKKRVLQAISPQIDENNLKRIIDSDSAKVKLEIISSTSQSPEVQKVVGLSEEIMENQILNEGQAPYKSQTLNKSQIRILSIKESKTSLRPIVKGSAKSYVSDDEGLPSLNLVSKKTHRSADQGLFSSGTIRAREMPDKEGDSRWPVHHDIFLDDGVMLSPYRFRPAYTHLPILGRKENFGAKTIAPDEEIATGRPTSSEPEIQITIGRIEVRAALSHTPSSRKSNTDSSSSSSLEEYLRKRSGGTRG